MILLRLAELIIIYITTISILFVQLTTSTNYWPQIKSQYLINQPQQQQRQQKLEQQQQQVLLSSSASTNPFISFNERTNSQSQLEQDDNGSNIRTALVAPAAVRSLAEENRRAIALALQVIQAKQATNSHDETNYHQNHYPKYNPSLNQQLQQQLQQQQIIQNHHLQNQKNQPIDTKKRQLLIGQHYNNFSSIVPYSIVQDSDYNSPTDQLMEEEEEEQRQQQQQLDMKLVQKNSLNDETIKNQNKAKSDQKNQLIIGNDLESSRSDSIMHNNNKAANSRALLPLDSNRLILPQMQQIKSRFNQGCVGGTKCQFFAFCWMSGGSLGASCGLLMTCCVTPSRQEIQPGFYGPVVNDPCKFLTSIT